ncbi:unnamed protein product [Mytilus coruscus]|uniref:Tc1-like transposase DDE domain-containing protein n=1 Tax=Mytilus coruscus TaxID=42192 RepID=A0A6J8C6A7_MYTCO|nr:unnamed protein product [Mytilus coruscus]
MPKFKLTHHDNMKIYTLYQQGWPVHAILRKLSADGIDISWGAVKNVIIKYQHGRAGYEHLSRKKIPTFKSITDADIDFVKSTLDENPTQTCSDIMRRLSDKGTITSKSTVRKMIDSAGYTASTPRYGQMIREANKLKRVEFCKQLIAVNEQFDDIIFTDEATVQLHDNKVVIYRRKDCVAPVLPKPKHPLKVHVWGGISRRGTTQILIFEGILKSDFFVNTILRLGLLPFIRQTYPDQHRFQQDNDPKHRSNLSKRFMQENQINWWDIWPSESPDFNPIEMVWTSSSHKRAKLCDGNQNQKASDDKELYIEDDEGEIYTDGYTKPVEETQTPVRTSLQSLIPPPDKPTINVRQKLGDTGVKRQRQPSPVLESESDDSDDEEAVHVHEVKVEIGETCSFAAENESYNAEEESLRTRRLPPPIPTEHDDCNNTVRTRRLPPPVPEEQNDCIENVPRRRSPPSPSPIHEEYDDYNGISNGDGSQSPSDEHGPMSSAPYASYSGNSNEVLASIPQTSAIRQEKQYSDHYNSMPNAMDSWKEPLTAVKTLVADNEETFVMETDTKEDEN